MFEFIYDILELLSDSVLVLTDTIFLFIECKL